MDPYAYFDCPGEQPLERLCPDGGFSAIFQTIGCVGDSLSSGEFETVEADGTRRYADVHEYSWGQFLARMNGSKVYNFSRGGMTAKEYCCSFAEAQDFWNPRYACQAYILALGCNDILGEREELGTVADIDLEDWRNNRPTFLGYYGQIVQRLKEIQPEAKFFFMTMPREDHPEELARLSAEHARGLRELADFFPNAYVMDFQKYAPVYDKRFRSLYYLNGHMNPCGYLLTAKMVASYLDYIIRHNLPDFQYLGLTGTKSAWTLET